MKLFRANFQRPLEDSAPPYFQVYYLAPSLGEAVKKAETRRDAILTNIDLIAPMPMVMLEAEAVDE